MLNKTILTVMFVLALCLAGNAFAAERILSALREHGFVPAQPTE